MWGNPVRGLYDEARARHQQAAQGPFRCSCVCFTGVFGQPFLVSAGACPVLAEQYVFFKLQLRDCDRGGGTCTHHCSNP